MDVTASELIEEQEAGGEPTYITRAELERIFANHGLGQADVAQYETDMAMEGESPYDGAELATWLGY